MMRALVLHTGIGMAATAGVALAAALWAPLTQLPPPRGPDLEGARAGLGEPELGKRLWGAGKEAVKVERGVDLWGGWGISARAAVLDVLDAGQFAGFGSHYRGPLEIRVGWPLRCWRGMAGESSDGPDYEPWVASAAAVQGYAVRPTLPRTTAFPVFDSSWPPSGRRGGPWAVVPLGTEALPLVLNVSFWGLVSWRGVAGVGSVRAWRRRRRGACVRCGYPGVGVAVCPECGP